MKKQVAMVVCLAWAAVCCLAGPSQAIKFKYEDLGTLGGNQDFPGFDLKEAGINDLGQVVGFSHTATGALQAFVKSPGQAMLGLPLFGGTIKSHAAGINHSGLISGWYEEVYTHACKWEPGPPYTVVNPDLSGDSVWAYGLNDAGYLVGTGLGGPNNNYHAQVFLPGGGKQDLGTLDGHTTSGARGINQANTIVGFSEDNSSVPTACIWSYSGGVWAAAEPLFGVADSKAISINTSGQAVGFTNANALYLSNGVLKGVLQSPGLPLQYLEGPDPSHKVLPYDINDSTWIVGYTDLFGAGAFLWTPAGGMQDLNNLVVNLPSDVFLKHAMAINQRGEIAGYSQRGMGFNGVFKLTPIIPLPNSMLLLD
jgi:probable HAF family extracellular repeat protein